MRAILLTENPDALPDELVKDVTVREREDCTETFVIIKNIRGAANLSTDSGVRIWTDVSDAGIMGFPDDSFNEAFDHGGGGEGGDFYAELVGASDNGTLFPHE